jgi:hypothetical protein
MAQNRRREEAEMRWGALVYTLLACAVLSVLGVLYVGQNRAHDQLGRRIAELENSREQLRRTLARQRESLTLLTSDTALRAKARQFGLDLTHVSANQRLTIYLPSPRMGPDVDRPEERPGGPGRPTSTALAQVGVGWGR